jgi:hypothetical protein
MQKHGSKIFEDEAMRIFDSLKEEVREGWRRVCTRELDDDSDVRWAGHV